MTTRSRFDLVADSLEAAPLYFTGPTPPTRVPRKADNLSQKSKKGKKGKKKGTPRGCSRRAKTRRALPVPGTCINCGCTEVRQGVASVLYCC